MMYNVFKKKQEKKKEYMQSKVLSGSINSNLRKTDFLFVSII